MVSNGKTTKRTTEEGETIRCAGSNKRKLAKRRPNEVNIQREEREQARNAGTLDGKQNERIFE